MKHFPFHTFRLGALVIAFLLTTSIVAHAAESHDHDDGHDHGNASKEPASHDEPGHAEHAGHEDEERDVIKLSAEIMREFGVEVQNAAPGRAQREIRLTGEVVYNADRVAHVTPTVAGIVKKVGVSVGDHVEAGQVMATLNSRELAAARSDYLASGARLALSETNLKRDQRLLADKVGTERSVLESQQAFAEAQIAKNQAENTLHAMGYSHEQIAQVPSLADTEFNTYQLTSPLSGVVTRRHLTIGELIDPTGDDTPFVVADLSTVWANLTVYQRDLSHVKQGQSVEIQFGHAMASIKGQVAFISPALDEATRTATARIVIDNAEGRLRPGLFITGVIAIDDEPLAIVVPRSAITELEGRQVVFIQNDEGFVPQPVKVGRTTEKQAEILAGLSAGDRYVTHGVLTLKAELNRGALEHAGHAH